MNFKKPLFGETSKLFNNNLLKHIKFNIFKKVLFTVLLAVLLINSIESSSGTLSGEEWNVAYEGVENNRVSTVRQTSDGCYIVAGSSDLYGRSLDLWLAKINPAGKMQWIRTFKGLKNEWGIARYISVQQTLGGGYLLLTEDLYDGDADFRIIKTDPDGKAQWNRTLYRSLPIQQTSDGGYIMAGKYDNQDSDYWSASDIWLIKLDSGGNDQYKVRIEDTYRKNVHSLIPTSDGHYIIAGQIISEDGKRHLYILKTDLEGNKMWMQIFEKYRGLTTIQQTLDGGYILVDSGSDTWIMKTDQNGNEQWSKNYQGTVYELLQQTNDGSYLLYTSNLIIHIDTEGNMQCVENFIKSEATSFHPTADGGLILAGNNASGFWLRKMVKEGAPPFVSFMPRYPGVHQQIRFDASLSCDPDENITVYQWDFGDGTITNTTEHIIIHSYASDGNYNVSLTTMNIDSIVGSTAIDITVQKVIPPNEQWNKTFGSKNSVRQTSDSGYILAGISSGIQLLKTDTEGNELWKRTYAGAYSQIWTNSVQETLDGGYIIVSSTYKLINGDPSEWICLLKIDSQGEEQWNQTYVKTGYNGAFSVLQTLDGGYFITGIIYTNHDAGTDFLLLKTNSNGNKQWQKIITWDESSEVYSAHQTHDGGFIIAGTTRWNTIDGDIWLLKLNSEGNEQWKKTYGETGCHFIAKSVQETSEGGYIIAGDRLFHGSDFFLIKTDSQGNMQWNKTFGGDYTEYSNSVIQTIDGGFIIAGETFSYGAGKSDFWLVKTDSLGNMQWHNSFGEYGCDKALSVLQTSDNGYLVSGEKSKDSTCDDVDFWLIKLEEESINETTASGEISYDIEKISSHSVEITKRNPLYVPSFESMVTIANLFIFFYLFKRR